VETADGSNYPIVRLYGHGLLDSLDCLGPVLPPPPVVIDALVATLRDHPVGTILDLAGLAPTSALLVGLKAWRRALTPGLFLMSEHAVCMVATGPPLGDSISGTSGRTLRKRLVRAQRDGFRLEVPCTPSEIRRSVEALFTWHQRKWRDAGVPEEHSALATLVREWSEQPWVRLPTLVSPDGRIAAVLMVLCGGDRERLYIQSYDPAFAAMSPSRCAIAMYLARLANHGGVPLDFLCGDESYKRDFCNYYYSLHRVTLACSDSVSPSDLHSIHCSFI